MSSFIDQLKAASRDPRSSRDLTLLVGQQIEAAGTLDLFASNPDFDAEYKAIKDEIARLNRPSIGAEIGRGFGSGIDQLQATGFGLGALAAEGAQKLGLHGAGAARDYMLSGVLEQQEQAAENPVSVPSFDKISGETPVEDALRYAAGGLGQILPSIGVSALTGLAGAAVGTAVEPGAGTVGGALLGLAERNLAKRVVDRALKQGLAITTEQAIAQIPKQAIMAEAKSLASKYAGRAALGASSIGQEVGGIYAEDPDAPNAAMSALGFGIPAGLLDMLPESYVLGRFFPKGDVAQAAVKGVAKGAAEPTLDAANGALSYWRKFAAEAAKTVPIESSTEAAQTLLELAASHYANNDPIRFTAEDYSHALNAGILGAIGGAVMAPISAAGGRDAAVTTPEREAATTQPLPEASAPEASASMSALPPEVQEAMAAVAAATGQMSMLGKQPAQMEPAIGPEGITPLSMQEAFSAQPPPAAPVSDLRKAATAAIQPPAPEPARPLEPTWKVTVQAADGDVAGFVQIDKIGPDGESQGSFSPEALRLQGYDVPPFTDLQQGQYQMSELLAIKEKVADSTSKVPAPSIDNLMPIVPKATVSIDDDDAIEAAAAAQSLSPALIDPQSPQTGEGTPAGQAAALGAGETPSVQLSQRANPQTSTPEFKAWFGDSKVVDAQGKPLVVYHGTKNNFEAFSRRHVRDSLGFHFGMTKDQAVGPTSRMGEGKDVRLVEAFVKLENPIELKDRGGWTRDVVIREINEKTGLKLREDSNDEQIVRALQSKGFDGVTYENLREGTEGSRALIAFEPNQIKSATGNRGTFDGSDPRITHTQRTSEDFRPAPSSAMHLLDSTVKALAQDRGIPVIPLVSSLTEAGKSAIESSGLVVDPKTQQVYIGYALQAINGNVHPQSIVALLHEAAHDFTNGLDENLRTAFHDGINQLPFTAQRWLHNPLSLEIKLLANSDPAQLSDTQRAALAQLTAEDVAAARSLPADVIASEKMAEHLAQLGWDRAEAVTAIDRLFRFIKDLWLKLSMAIQQALKGPEHTNPELAQQFVENRFLQFINRDAAYAKDRINNLRTWLGVPETTRERQQNFPGGGDTEMRMQYADPETQTLIPISYGTTTPDALKAYLKRSIDNAARFIREDPARGQSDAGVQLTQRAHMGPPLSFEPAATHNIAFAAVNLEEELYQQIKNSRNIAAMLPRVNGVIIDDIEFMQDWLRLPSLQMPAERRLQIESFASQTKDPLTGQPVAADAKITVAQLPSFTETLTDKEKEAVKVQLSEQQDEALKQTIWSMRDTQRRMQAKLKRDVDRLNELVMVAASQGAKFPRALRTELDELQRDTLIRVELIKRVIEEIRRLESKFDPRKSVVIAPTLPYLRVPSADATEEDILANKRGVVARDLNYSSQASKEALGADLAAMQAWLAVPENRNKGSIYGTISETYRKLNQIPTDLKRVHTNVMFRRTMTHGLAEELRLTGIPALVALQKKFTEATRIFNENRTDFHNLGVKWEAAFVGFAKAMGMEPDQTFRETVWNPLMRIKNSIDVSRRTDLKSTNWGGVIDTAAKAMNAIAGLEVNTPARRETLRDLLLSVIDNEKAEQSVALQNNLKVQDDGLDLERRLIPRGLVTGRVTLSRELRGLFARMNPLWSDTTPVSAGDPRSFWQAAGDLYRTDRATFDKKIATLFQPYIVSDFVDPWANWTEQIFEAPVAQGEVSRKAATFNVRLAWRDAKGDITRFAERLHTLEGGLPGDEGQTVANVLRALRQKFEKTKRLVDEQLAHEGMSRETLPRQMMDSRDGFDLPPEHVGYATYTPTDNLTLLQHLAMNAAFGRNPLGTDSELHMTLMEARRDLAALWSRHEELMAQGLTPKQIEAQMGGDDAKIARNYWASSEGINNLEKAMRAIASNTGYLTGDFRTMNEALSLFSTMMVQSPRSGAINIIGDVVGATASLGFSRPGLKAFWKSGSSVVKDMATAILRAFGANVKFNTNLAHELYVNGGREPDMALTVKQKSVTLGSNLNLTKPAGFESTRAKVARGITRVARTGREILPDLGSPLQAQVRPGDEAAAVAPKLRIGFFGTTALSTMLANNRAGHAVFSDLAMRGVKYINSLSAAQRDQYVRKLELGTADLDGRQLGYNRGVLFSDDAAFAYLKSAIETKLSGESSVGRFAAKAWRRQQGSPGKWDVLSNSQFSDIINLTNSDWTLQTNFATIPYWMANNPLAIFLKWPYLAMQRFGRTFTDPQGRITYKGFNSTVANGMKTFFLLAAPATIAGSFAIDEYDEKIQGKRQNLRETSVTTLIPVVGAVMDPRAFMERIGRYGSAGFAGDILNRIVNYDTQRNLSLDDRIVAVSSIEALLNSLVVEPYQTGGNITYSSTVRPFLQAIGSGGVLQYVQVANNLLGLNNEDAALNARINVGNILRATGRDIGLNVRVMTGPSEAPTPVSPYLRQMEIAAGIGNNDLFNQAYRDAVQAAFEDGPPSARGSREGAAKYVVDNFSDRHPLRRIFRTSPTESEYRKLLNNAGDFGANAVRRSINSYNSYLNRLGKKSFLGKEGGGSSKSIDELIKESTRLMHQGSPDFDLATF